MNLIHQEYLIIKDINKCIHGWKGNHGKLFIKELKNLINYTAYLKRVVCTQQDEINVLEKNIDLLNKEIRNE